MLGLCCTTQALAMLWWAGASPCRTQASHCSCFSSWRAQTSEHRPSSCGSWALLLLGLWDLPRPGIELVFPVLQGRLLTSGPSGKPHSPSHSVLHFKCSRATMTSGHHLGQHRYRLWSFSWKSKNTSQEELVNKRVNEFIFIMGIDINKHTQFFLHFLVTS